MAIKLADTLAPMANFPAAMAEHIGFNDGDTLQEKYETGQLGGGGGGYTQLSQAEYDALTDDEKMNGKEYRTYDTGHIYKLGIEYGKDADIKRNEVLKTYVSLYDLNTKKGLSLAWENNVDNTQKIIDALEGREEFIDSFSSSTNRIGIVGNYGTTINNFHIIKRSADLAIITATTNAGTILNRTYTNGTLSDWCVNIAVYTSLEQLGLTAPVTVGDIFNAVPNKTMAIISCEDITVHITDAPTSYGILTIKKNDVGRFSIDYQSSLASSPCNVKRWIGTLKGSDGTGLYWKEVAYKDNLAIYKSLSELGLDTTATLKDITRAMAKNTMVAIKVDAMANQSEYNNILQGTVTIYKIEDARIQAIMTNKVDGRTWIAILGGENTIIGWKELRSDSPFYRIVTQGVAGYFKFKPTSNGIDQSLRISVTDNYGGMINISGAKPTASQYKPFKCIRLSYGEYTNYDAMKLANNKMLKLFYYDGYFYLKVTTYTTCTFTGLLEAPTYVETFNETDAEEIPIRSVFDTPYNDGYADPSIIAIGDADSSDGVIKKLSTLGFTEDVMTWDTGEYRISHVGGLTNLPSEITEEKPGFRLAHYDVKKWGSNHNPYVSTYGCRQSVLHYKGDIYVRYTESGATAGVLIADTGWKKIQIGNTKETLAFNSKTFKIDITKGREAWNGNIKFGYCVDNSYGEIIISSLGATKVTWSCSEGVRYVKSVTYTIDPDNKAHVTIGVELHDIVYGVHQLETSGDFATINSFTGDAFTGTSVAERQGIRGRNNGVGILCEVADLGLTTPCTTIQIAQAMKNLSNYIGRIPTSGMIGIFDNGGNTITDAPSQYGLLQVNVYGYDRVMIRYDGIGSSSYTGSWIGKIKGSNGTFSEVTWERIDDNFNGKEVKTVTIDLSASDLQYTANDNAKGMSLSKYIAGTKNIIKVEGYYNVPSSVNSTRKKIIIKPDTDIVKPGSIVYDTDNWYIVVYGSTTGAKGSGFVKIYYVE